MILSLKQIGKMSMDCGQTTALEGKFKKQNHKTAL